MSHGHRRSLRLKGHSYIEGGAYFITVCTYWRRCILGEIRDDEMHLNDLGVAVAQAWRATPDHFPLVQNDAFVVMPNHIHGLIPAAISRPHGQCLINVRIAWPPI